MPAKVMCLSQTVRTGTNAPAGPRVSLRRSGWVAVERAKIGIAGTKRLLVTRDAAAYLQ